jgi:serine O-acetyltransferase
MTYKAVPPIAPSIGSATAADGRINNERRISAFMAFRQMLGELRQDIDRYSYMKNSYWLKALMGNQGLWLMVQYRFSRWVHFHFQVPVLRLGLKLVGAITQKFLEMITGVEIPNRAEIGGGLFMPHANGIIIHMEAKIGRNCNISQQVTVGVGGNAMTGTPTIGDRVFLGPGAKLFGPITVGNDVAVGANAVVLKDLPDRAVAVGVPAKVVSHKGAMNLVTYRGHPTASIQE